MEEIEVLGIKIPRYIDCPKCGNKESCKWAGYAYAVPCEKCRDTKEFEEQQAKHEKVQDHIGNAIKSHQIAGVWQYKGRNIYTNHKGDVIDDEPYKPLKSGDPEWKRKS